MQIVARQKRVLVLSLDDESGTSDVRVLGQDVRVTRIGCGHDIGRVQAAIVEHDGHADAIALEGIPSALELGSVHAEHDVGGGLRSHAKVTPVVDGHGIRSGFERWAVDLADRKEPGIFSHKRVLMLPGLNHTGLAQALQRRASRLRYSDPFLFFGLPHFPGVGSRHTLEQAAPATLETLKHASLERLYPAPARAAPPVPASMFRWANVLAGDSRTIRGCAPADLSGKTVVVESVDETDIEDLTKRGASILVTMMPDVQGHDGLAGFSAAVIEALLVAVRPRPDSSLSEDTYLNLISDLEWTPGIRSLQPQQAGINRFAFVIHPVSFDYIRKHPGFRWARFLPDRFVEWCAAYLPPLYVSRITGARSPITGQRVEGYLYSLGATPRQMLSHGEHFTYRRLSKVARLAERRGARIMGLGAFTSVIGDAGISVARESDIAVTSGNSLTVAATLEAAKRGIMMMGATDLTKGKVMIVGATGSIGAVCARLIARAIRDVVLISVEPEKLIQLKRTIQEETPGASVIIGTRTREHLAQCDLVITATSAFGQRVIDLARCKPGAVICDVARPHDISPEEAAVRPDVLVIDSGEVLIPGDFDIGYDIGLPPKVSYACLAETVLLAMDGQFVDFTLGRRLEVEKVKQIYHLFKKHGFEIAGLRSFDQLVTEEDVAQKRALAAELGADPRHFEQTVAEASARLARIPVSAKGIRASTSASWLPTSWLRRMLEFFTRHFSPRPTFVAQSQYEKRGR